MRSRTVYLGGGLIGASLLLVNWAIRYRGRRAAEIPEPFRFEGYTSGSGRLHGFSCGEGQIDQFAADADRQSRSAAIHMMVREADLKVVGFFTLTNMSLPSNNRLKRKFMSGLSHDVPAILLGQLGVSMDEQGKGFAKDLLYEAMRVARDSANRSRAVLLVVDSLDHGLVDRLYVPVGFTALADNKLRLILRLD